MAVVVAPRWDQRRLSLPTLAVSAIITFFSSAPVSSFISSSPCWLRPRISCCASTSVTLHSSTSDGEDGSGRSFSYLTHLERRLNLTPDQATLIHNRLGGITPRKKKQQQKQQKCNNDVTVEQQTIKRNLAYLEERLGMTIEQLRRVVVGYPQVLSMRLETNLIPTAEFFGDALCGGGDSSNVDSGITTQRCDNDDHGNNIQYDVQQDYGRRLSAFLCESPNLLEYNVAKRLTPRLKRLRSTIVNGEGGSAAVEDVDEEMLHTIATLTDSRFETWLLYINDIQKSGKNETTTDGGAVRKSHIVNEAWKTDLKPQILSSRNTPSSYVIVSNLQSGGNIGNIIRSASIFGCEECIIVGQKRLRMTGDHGSRLDLPRRHMWSHADVKDYLNSKRVRIYGIEIMESASPIMKYDRETGVVNFPFKRECEGGWSGSAFIFGNEGQGLSTKQREICDEFLFIPQNRGADSSGSMDHFAGRVGGGGGSASMNVACAAAVVLQAYCMWAGYSEARCEGEKFLLDFN